ncbi:MAG: TIGR00303 family protein [Caldisphaera sp.]|nr:MAG: TIGR00303 family protein [Caldisphaera sp.]
MNAIGVYVGGSTETSTIEGISIAGSSNKDTLYTPTLDLEYLVNGLPITKKEIPVTPEGLPTPAVITRSVLENICIPFFVVDSGLFYKLKVPHILLPNAMPGSNIKGKNALKYGTAKSIFYESIKLGEIISRNHDVVLIGESIPGGTTTASAIMEGLGYEAIDLVSSTSPNNPKELKRIVVKDALKRIKKEINDVFYIVDEVGDPVHIALAGIAFGSSKNSRIVLLSGGTQMGAVISILTKLGLFNNKIKVATTKWIINDKDSNIVSLLKQINNVEIISSDLDFRDSKYDGLKLYEEGYVKEGVGAGGTLILAKMLGFDNGQIKKFIYNEYERLEKIGKN